MANWLPLLLLYNSYKSCTQDCGCHINWIIIWYKSSIIEKSAIFAGLHASSNLPTTCKRDNMTGFLFLFLSFKEPNVLWQFLPSVALIHKTGSCIKGNQFGITFSGFKHALASPCQKSHWGRTRDYPQSPVLYEISFMIFTKHVFVVMARVKTSTTRPKWKLQQSIKIKTHSQLSWFLQSRLTIMNKRLLSRLWAENISYHTSR